MRKTFDELTAGDAVRGGGITVPEAMSLRGAARLLAEAEAGSAPVVDTQGRCVGLLCTSDIVRWLAEGEGSDPGVACYWSEWQIVASGESEVSRRMTTDPPVIPPDTPLRDVARVLIARRITAVVVDHRHRPLGILSPADVLAAVPTDRGRPERDAPRLPARSS